MTTATPTYHHGDLPTALRRATVELVTEKGVAGFSLREVARRAGVSHAAPAHHFGDTEGLLTSVAAEGFRTLADEMAKAAEIADGARDRLYRTGIAYVRVNTDNPAHMAIMTRKDLVCNEDPQLLAESVRSYELLLDTVRAIRDELNPDLDVDAAATFCWASIQGLVQLSPKLEDVAEDTGTRTAPIEVLVDQFTDFLLTGMTGD